MIRFSKLVLIFTVLSIAYDLQAQHQELSESPNTWSANLGQKADTLSLLETFKNGKVSGHFRQFYMNTNNEGSTNDAYALAIGGGLKYETAFFYHFQFALSGFYVFNLASSDLTKNRYEIGLFDINNAENKTDINRLEELYLRYQFRNKGQITLGKQLLNTPFINLQDGRMRPTEVNGLWLNTPIGNTTKLEGGYLFGISPRSTVKYYEIGKSFGIYPSGVDTEGRLSQYHNNIESKAIYYAGITHKSIKNTSLQLWNMYVQNVFNSSLFQTDHNYKLNPNLVLKTGIQAIYQTAVKDGGNEDQTITYLKNGAQSFSYGAKLGLKNKHLEFFVAYNRITALGRYLMPREWGRDPFYTFMPRERNEGFGDVHAYVMSASYTLPKHPFKTMLSFGYFDLPDVKNFELNKYGMPAYTQANIDMSYKWKGFLNGLDVHLLWVHKFGMGETYDNSKFITNKVEMSNLNIILNFHF